MLLPSSLDKYILSHLKRLGKGDKPGIFRVFPEERTILTFDMIRGIMEAW